MPRWCEVIPMQGGGTMFVTHSGPRTERPKPCVVCGKPADRLCDWDLGGGKTCDAPICRRCAWRPVPTFGKPETTEIDYCPRHKAMFEAEAK